MIALLEKHYLLVLLRQESLHILPERFGFGEHLFLSKILAKLHGLYKISHPFFAEVDIPETKLQRLLLQLQTDEVKLLFSKASDSLYCLDGDFPLLFLVSPIIVEFKNIYSQFQVD